MFEPIAYIKTDFIEKFGIPRQSGRAPSLKGRIEFLPKYSNPEAFRGIEEFNYIWIIFDFSKAHKTEWSPTVRPPRLGGNTRTGVFATRSPFRPNNIGLSSVKLEKVEYLENKTVLTVSGVDILNDTPIYDIKPYVKYSDCHTDAVSGFAERFADYRLNVEIPERISKKIDGETLKCINECLADDPRPSYISDGERVYKMKFKNYDVSFIVKGDTVTVTEIE